MNHRAKFGAASFILFGEIHNRTNIQTHKPAVHDISTPRLLVCVDNNGKHTVSVVITFVLSSCCDGY